MRDRIGAHDVAIGVGILCVVSGVAMLSIAAALIVAGLLVIAIAAGSYRTSRGPHGTANRMA